MKPIQMLWIGGELSKIEHLSIKSFLSNGHDVHLYTYGEVRNVPSGTVICEGDKIISRERIFKVYDSYAAFSDLFRFILLEKMGGFWMDTDMICLKRIEIDEEYMLCAEDSYTITPSAMKLPKNNLISQRVCDNFSYSDVNNWKQQVESFKKRAWGEIGGPIAITKIYKESNLDAKIDLVHPDAFYPVHWKNWYQIFYDKELMGRLCFDDIYGVHLWNNMLSNDSNFDKNAQFEKGTLMRYLCDLYL